MRFVYLSTWTVIQIAGGDIHRFTPQYGWAYRCRLCRYRIRRVSLGGDPDNWSVQHEGRK